MHDTVSMIRITPRHDLVNELDCGPATLQGPIGSLLAHYIRLDVHGVDRSRVLSAIELE
jgi:hypothetical protein